MMLLKCCTQYANKFGKLSSGHRTGKGQFSFQSQRKAMSKNGLLLLYKNERIWPISNEVDEPRAYYTKRSKSERQILYVNARTWNLERWYWWAFIQSSNGEADIVNRLLAIVREREGGMIWESSTETYTLPYIKQRASENLMYNTGNPKLVLCNNLEGGMGREV